jgi:glycosyltransferase involved in cell wall biosynthesis
MRSVCTIVQGVYDIDPRVRRKAEALVSAGYTVDVLALRPEGGKKQYTVNGVQVHTIALGKKRGSLARYAFEYCAFFLWAMWRLTRMMRRRRYSIVDVNTLPDFLIFAAIVARWMGATLVLDMHEITPEFYISKYGIAEDSWLIRLLKYLERISFNFADYVITINEPILQLLVGRGLSPSKAIVVMNAVDESRFVAKAAPPLGADSPPGRFVMMYHGTLTPIYGLDIAIEALALAGAQAPGAELWILGSGTEQEKLARLAEERGVASRVKLIGQVPAATIPDWLAQCDAGILPIRRDVFLDFAFPNKLPEFIIAGKPTLVSRLRAIRHYFGEEALAFFEPNSAAALASEIVRLAKDRPRRDRLVIEARRQYEPIRWDLMKQRYLTLVEVASGSSVAKQPSTAETTKLAG